MILGLRTVIYVAPDLGHGKEWYSQLLGFGPYFDQPYYVGFSVGAFELGLVPDGTPSPDGARVYWGVANAAQELERINSLGAVTQEALHDVGEGIKVASVKDPFGNVFGIIENPHFDPGQVR